jgi:hypothetical protein
MLVSPPIHEWVRAAESGSLLTPKHDPGELHVTWARARSILSNELSSNLCNFISGRNYTVNHYADSRYPHGLGYFEIIPDHSTSFTIPGSGVAPYALLPSVAYDRLIIISGLNQGWHIIAESSLTISGSISGGRLHLLGTYHE